MKLIAKLFGLEVVDRKDCPFDETTVNGKAVLVKTNNYVIVG